MRPWIHLGAIFLLIFASPNGLAKGRSCRKDSDCAIGCRAHEKEANCYPKSMIRRHVKSDSKLCRNTLADVGCICYADSKTEKKDKRDTAPKAQKAQSNKEKLPTLDQILRDGPGNTPPGDGSDQDVDSF